MDERKSNTHGNLRVLSTATLRGKLIVLDQVALIVGDTLALLILGIDAHIVR